MNPQVTTLLLITGGAGIATIALFATLHATFQSALMQTERVTPADDSSVYFGRIY